MVQLKILENLIDLLVHRIYIENNCKICVVLKNLTKDRLKVSK